ncbi:xanthine dehydrogenase subunit XdhA [Candidatus Formimonas warabiya]|uniref:xanthine dehydrogenase subunit XdhA n=1 Tax=Formimonas warabiya TaxID=1761012 RepID=UPI0011D0AAE8|nr:xanthine dehydrogenase subunit XdhA [Candidatus Formimonas warabiya]
MDYQHIGKSTKRIDVIPKVTGKAKFVGDIKIPGMLYGKILWSALGHAKIKRIETDPAKRLPGVKAVITWKDVPRHAYCPAGHPYPDDSPQDMYILDKTVRFLGDPVAAVAAESKEIAQKALGLIKVEYEELPLILSPEEALKENAPEIHEGTKNICGQHSYEFGNVLGGFKNADLIIEDEFRTPIVQHCPIENHASLAYLDNDARLIVHSATQIPFHLRRILSQVLGMPMGKIKVIKSYVGGGFGGKEDVCQEPINAVLALTTGNPVLLEFSREEEMVSTRTRHSMILELKSGVMKNGELVARELKVLSNTGAYAAHGHCVVYNIDAQFPVLYPTPNISFAGLSVYTNMPIASAMRSYGISQYNFAMESHMDNIAQRLGMDPLDLRLKNICKLGYRDPQAYFSVNSCGIEECLNKGKELSNWVVKRGQKSNGIKKRGLGMACLSYASSTYPYNAELSGARIKMNEDGSATLFIGSAEIGQGNDTIMAQIAAEELGIDVESIHVIAVDTDLCPIDMGAYASRQSSVCGMAVKKAGVKCRKAITGFVGSLFNRDPEDLLVKYGVIYDGLTGESLISVKDAAMKAHYTKGNSVTIDHEAYFSPGNNPLAFGAVFAEVEVDTGTGKVEVEKIWALHDSGKILNYQAAEGQVHGGVSMGFAYGTSEQLLIDKNTGRVLNGNLLDYKMPTILDVPPVDVTFVETIEPSSAYGNKALGEPPCISVAPAVRNAVLNAIGVAYNEIPLTPEKILLHLKRTVL